MRQVEDFLIFDGSQKLGLILAHGAGAPMNSPFMLYLAKKISEGGFPVVLFEFDYMKRARQEGRRLPPDRPDKLLARWQGVIQKFSKNSLVIGGKSMGGRMASVLLSQNPNLAKGLICLGYPFHPPGKPETLRVDHLEHIKTPTLICQGERDALGNREEVEGMTFPKNFEFLWVPDGDHSFKPRVQSGRTEQANLDLTTGKVLEFLGKLV